MRPATPVPALKLGVCTHPHPAAHTGTRARPLLPSWCTHTHTHTHACAHTRGEHAAATCGPAGTAPPHAPVLALQRNTRAGKHARGLCVHARQRARSWGSSFRKDPIESITRSGIGRASGCWSRVAGPHRQQRGLSLGNTKQDVAEQPAESFCGRCFSSHRLSPGKAVSLQEPDCSGRCLAALARRQHVINDEHLSASPAARAAKPLLHTFHSCPALGHGIRVGQIQLKSCGTPLDHARHEGQQWLP